MTGRWPADVPELLVKAPVFVVEFLVWWHFFGDAKMGKGTREHRLNSIAYMARIFAVRAVHLVGGWRNARLLLRGWVPDPGVGHTEPTRRIRIRDDDDHLLTGQ